ncbi:hypothetical protein U472_09125 [Orenia metallireducens]|uniref:TonB C-terminal domain-containing protein n=1 Tax=Orenia metallireducens TaxID=1413210 RepID=A0A1C0A7F2_9FIRM|nr:energy transducer TonB [Orenia metallireducens]OCL26167.1 hypothetical protein U472_09125 [Orenia metallireducens]
MAYKKKRQGEFSRFFIISLIIHGILLYMFSFINLGVQPTFQSDPINYTSQLDLLYLEDGIAKSRELVEHYQEDSKSKKKEPIEEVKQEKEDKLPQIEEANEDVAEIKDPKEELIEEKPKLKEVAQAEKTAEERIIIEEQIEAGSEEKVEGVSLDKDNEVIVEDKVEEDVIEEHVEVVTQEVKEEVEEVITSQSSTEEIKVAQKKVEEKEKAPVKQEEAEAITEQKVVENKEGKEEKAEVKEEVKEVPPPPPPAPKDMILSNVIPRYPKNASNTGIEGDVKLLVKVKASGEIDQVEIIESSEYEQLDNQAKRTVQYGWKFKADKSNYEVILMVHFRYIDHQNQVDVEYLGLSFDQK